MRDHLLGYPAAAQEAAYQEEALEFGYCWGDDPEEYPLGVPTRVNAEWRERRAAHRGALIAANEKLHAFESVVQPFPDGSFPPPKREPARLTDVSLADALQRAWERNAAKLAENVMRNNVLFHKGISAKPPPVMFQGTPVLFDAPKEAEHISDVFMAGYKLARTEETKALAFDAPMRADLWAKQRAEQLRANDEARGLGALIGGAVLGGHEYAEGCNAVCKAQHIPGYDVLHVSPADVIQPTEFTLKQCALQFTSL